MKRSFDGIIESIKEGLSTYDYFVDFKKVFSKVEHIELKLNTLNYLIGKDNFDEAFKVLLEEHPNIITVIPVLLAVRENNIQVLDEVMKSYNFNYYDPNVNYIEFIRKTGLIDLFYDKRIKNLVDYVTGVEVGLDTNSRKNRSGKMMSQIVLKNLKDIPNIDILEEANTSKIYKEFGVNISNTLKDTKSNKRFDFVIKDKMGHIYLIETNYYGTSGSKLNETSRSYAKLAKDIKEIDNVSFVWITDGKGWLSTKKNLEEAYNDIEHLYTLYDLEHKVLHKLFNT
ncbi:type II restriction endonuclease [Acholeplasma laidlawii]|uniref:type II restriction endonuclease n=1 Tax=Acholeplasma laidlawii TaxID=2148 RepID=UPI0021F78EA8|nr:type II restriction endonuclease [Acholeplasma laidlawii]